MAACKKYSQRSLKNFSKLANHFERGTKYDEFKGNRSNENIDKSRSHLNYNLLETDKKLYDMFLEKKASVYVLNREDLNVLGAWVVTKPKDVKEEDTKKFFKEVTDFVVNRYGKDNVLGAYVHMDETTPHIHIPFMPIVPDYNEKGKHKNFTHKISMGQFLGEDEFRDFHIRLSKHIENSLGYKTEILNGATVFGNKTVAELKAISLTEKINENNKILKMQIDHQEEYLEKLSWVREDLKEAEENLEKAKKKNEISQKKLEEVNLEKINALKELEQAKQEKDFALKEFEDTKLKNEQALKNLEQTNQEKNAVQEELKDVKLKKKVLNNDIECLMGVKSVIDLLERKDYHIKVKAQKNFFGDNYTITPEEIGRLESIGYYARAAQIGITELREDIKSFIEKDSYKIVYEKEQENRELRYSKNKIEEELEEVKNDKEYLKNFIIKNPKVHELFVEQRNHEIELERQRERERSRGRGMHL